MNKPDLSLRKLIGRKIKALRVERKWGQEDLGQRVWGRDEKKVYQSRVGNYERGYSEIGFADLERFARVFGVPVIAFFADVAAETVSRKSPVIQWGDLMKLKRNGRASMVKVKIPNDDARGFLKGQIIRVDPEVKPKHHNFVVVSNNKQPFLICEFFSHKGRQYFKPLDGRTQDFEYNEKTTYIFGVVVSQEIFHR